MFLIRKIVLIGLLVPLIFLSRAWAADIENPLEIRFMGGVDAWSMRYNQNVENLSLIGSYSDAAMLLGMADSSNQWSYHSMLPWFRFEGNFKLNAASSVHLRARADAAFGAWIDEFYYDQEFSPKLGYRVGVVDYNLRDCRTYETDSPWVRENDPFCSMLFTAAPTLAAPGIQLYANIDEGGYKIQSIVGVYRPLLFDYDPNENDNMILSTGDRVVSNQKYGGSISIINKDHLSKFRFNEFRFSYLKSIEQSYFGVTDCPCYFNSASKNFYYLFKFDVTDEVAVRYHKQNGITDGYTLSPYETGSYASLLTQPYPELSKSTQEVDIDYKISARNKFVFGSSAYIFNAASGDYSLYSQSIAYRHDFEDSMFVAVQVTDSHYLYNISGLPVAMSGAAFGIRMGYVY